MKKLIDFSKKYNLIDFLLIFFISLLFFLLFYAKQGSYIVDVGREAYIPWQMLEGNVLYKDIFNVYGPLGYQINTLAYSVFGTSLNTLYLMGFLNSLTILFFSYLCTRLFATRKIAFSCVLLTLSVCVYSKHFFNFIFPYSYSAVYALSSFLISLFCALLYIKNQNFKHLIISFLFAGVSFTHKIEYLPYFGFLFVSLPFLLPKENKKDWKKYLACYSTFFIFPTLSFGVLLLQGANFSDFLKAFEYSTNLIKTPAAEYFYNAFGLTYNPLYIKLSFETFLKVLKYVIPTACAFYILNFYNDKFVKNKVIKNLTNIVIFAFLSIVSVQLTSYIINDYHLFNWLGLYSIVLLFGFFIYFLIIKRQSKTTFSQIDKMFLFLLFSSILVSIKGICGISTECYGTFSLTCLFIPFLIFIATYFPKINLINKETLEKTILNICFVIFAVYILTNINSIAENIHPKPITNRGTIFVKNNIKSQQSLIKFIKQNTPKNATIVTAPEGAIINFLAERKSHNFYYYLIPVNVQLFTEDKILNDFEKNKPDYFLINNTPYSPFNVGDFCSYAKKICAFIEENYQFEVQTTDPISFVLYKKKK